MAGARPNCGPDPPTPGRAIRCTHPSIWPTAAQAIPHEAGKNARTVLIQFDSVEAATAAYSSPAYQEALAALGDGAVRDIRIVEGVD